MNKLSSKLLSTALIVLIAFSISNCSAGIEVRPTRQTSTAKRLPPGQAKKIYGGKSAKSYAPGHNKNS